MEAEDARMKVYACYNINKDVRMSSSSGAVFSSLADATLKKQGIVYGVEMSEDCYSAKFTRVTDAAGPVRLRGSKYLQAKVGSTFKQVKEDLSLGKQVLFSGTGCQVNGLKKFLGKEYNNLICVDVICHGAPSPALWRKYAEYQEKQNGGKLKGINFRCKDYSWADFGMKEVLKDIPDGKDKKLYISKDKDPYMQMFLRNYCLRPSCYNCIAKKFKTSDLTIADFWGINDVAPEMNDGNGTSLILIRTDKGSEVLESVCKELKLKEVSYEAGVKGNPSEYKSCTRPLQRDTFFHDMYVMSFEDLEKKYILPVKVTIRSRVKRKIKVMIKYVLCKILGGGYSLKKHVNKMKNMDYSLCFVFNCQDQEK